MDSTISFGLTQAQRTLKEAMDMLMDGGDIWADWDEKSRLSRNAKAGHAEFSL